MSLMNLHYGHADYYLLGMDKLIARVIIIQRLWKQCLEWKRVNKHIPIYQDIKEYILKPFFVTINRNNLDLSGHISIMYTIFDTKYIRDNFVGILYPNI